MMINLLVLNLSWLQARPSIEHLLPDPYPLLSKHSLLQELVILTILLFIPSTGAISIFLQ